MAVSIPIISDFDGKGISRAISEFQNLEGAGAKAQFALKKAAVPAMAAIAGLAAGLGSAAKAAMEDAAAQDHLAGVLVRSGMATDDQIASNEMLLSSMSRSAAVADDDLRPALATLVQSTGSLEFSQELLSQALDISASTGADLTTTTDALSKAYNGNMKGLKALDASLGPLIKEGMSFEEVMSTLAATTGGAAADAANTAQGQFKNFGIQMGEAKESIGAALLPVIQKLLDVLMPLATLAQENTQLFLIFAGVIGGVAAAVLIANTAMKVYRAGVVIATAAQAAFNFIMSANPIALVVIGIAALIAVFVLLEKKFGVVSMAFEFFSDGFRRFVIDPIQAGIALISKLIGAFKSIPGMGAIGGLIGKIPGLAEGGIVTGPTLAMIGERGPEAVVPLNRANSIGGSTTINVYSTIADASLPDKIVNALRQYNRRSGVIDIRVA